MAKKTRKPRRKVTNASALLQYLPPCSYWRQGIASGWYKSLDDHRYSSFHGRFEAASEAARDTELMEQRHGSIAFFEPYVWVQCVPDAEYVIKRNFHHGANHRNHMRTAYNPECWLPGSPNGACAASDGPSVACKGCYLPLHPGNSKHFGVSFWQSYWTVDAGDTEAPSSDRRRRGGEGEWRHSHRAARSLGSYLHSTHNRGPFHWVPFLEMFDWLLLQWNPGTYAKIDGLLKRHYFWKWPEGANLPSVGAFLVRQVETPRTVFITIPLLPYFWRFFLQMVPETGVALYFGRGWEDASIPAAWLHMLVAHPQVLHVFAENPKIRHPKITPMPIGLDPVALQGESGKALGSIAAEAAVHLDDKIIDRAVGGWAVIGPVRRAAKEYMISTPWCDWVDTTPPAGEEESASELTRQVEYWRRVARYGFIVSPPAVYQGEGPAGPLVDTDSYRTFEGLVLRTIPILWDGPNAWAWEGLPVVTVKNWTEITPENMRRWWNERRHFLEGDQPYLRSTYWWAKIERALNASRRSPGHSTHTGDAS